MISTILLTLFALQPALAKDSGESEPKVELRHCQLALGGGPIALQVRPPSVPGRPAFFFLPGVNRAVLTDSPMADYLHATGAGVAAMNFSPQPFSLSALEAGEAPAYRTHKVTLESLAAEVAFVKKHLEQIHGLTNLIPVSLSYSGAVSPFLKDFPVIVDMVPMTSAPAQNPHLRRYRNWLGFSGLFFGRGYERGLTDHLYRSDWIGQVDDLIKRYGLPAALRAEMIEGYISLSQAAEDFAWENVIPDKKARRVFVLAEKEGRELLAHQLKTFWRLLEEGYDVRAILVRETGHMIFDDQPLAAALILHALGQAGGGEAGDPRLIAVTPSTGATESLDGAAAVSYLSREVNK